MKTTTVIRLLLCCFLLPVAASAAEENFRIVQKEEMGLDAGERIKTFLLHGDPAKPGLYIMRIRFPPGQASRPHSHDQDRFITVIEGTWHVGMQKDFDMSQTTPVKAGGFMVHPAGAVHFDGARDEAVVVEIRGMGPVRTMAAGD